MQAMDMTLIYIVIATLAGGLLSVTIAAALTVSLLGRLVKGLVSLSAGVLLGIEPVLGLMTLGTWLAVAFVSRYSSLAALSAAVLAPLYYWAADGVLWFGHPALLLAVAAMSALLLGRHQANIMRLISGTEGKIGGKG